MTNVVNINDVLDGHLGLDLDCIDRLYLNAYVPNMQVGGQVQAFCRHLDQPIASPAVIEKIGNRFRCEVDAFALKNNVPILHLKKPDRSRWDDRKLDHVRPYMDKAAQAGRYGVVAIVAAQEFQYVFSATKKSKGKAVWFNWNKTERRVSCFYFYIHDREFAFRPSATASGPPMSRGSSTAGSPASPPRSRWTTEKPGTSGTCPCARWR